MRRWRQFTTGVLLVAVLAPSGLPQAASTVLSYENFTDGTNLTTQVPGVTFTNAVVLSAGISLNEFEFPPHSGINVVSDNGGPMTLVFFAPVKTFSANFTYSTSITLTAYDTSGNQAATASSQFTNNEALSGVGGSAPNELISLNFAAGIARITITGAPGGGSFAMDDTTVTPPLVAPPPVVITPGGTPPFITSFNFGTVPLGSSLAGTLTASGGTPPYSWSAAGPVPPGVSISNDGKLTGQPTQAGVNTFQVAVRDAQGLSAGGTISFSVLAITTTSFPDAKAFTNYSQPLLAIGGTPPYTFSGINIPGGLQVTGATLSGTPNKQGSYQFTIQASDANNVTVSQTVKLNVGAPPPLAVSSATLPGGNVGLFYSQPLAATGGAPPYTWAVTSGAIPAGLALSSFGVLRGTPASTGKFSFGATVTDTLGSSKSATFTVAITPPALTLNAAPVLPAGMVGIEYPSQVVTASGGTAPYTFSAGSGAITPGLVIDSDGTIAGTPTKSGSYTFGVAATDAAGTSTNLSLSLTVRPLTTDLALSAGSLVFAMSQGSADLPPSQTIEILPTNVAAQIGYSAAVTAGIPWLSVSPATGVTPGPVTVSLNAQALSLAASTTPYQASVVISCAASSPCSGSSQTIGVSLVVGAAGSQLLTSPAVLAFTTSATQPASQSLHLENAGGGAIGISSVVSGAPWLTVQSFPATLAANQQGAGVFSADPTGLTAGYYQSNLTVSTSIGTTTVPVTLFVTDKSQIALTSGGTQFEIEAGAAPAAIDNTFQVVASGPVNWAASVAPAISWLTTTTPGGTAAPGANGSVAFALDSATVAGLAPGKYYGTIWITSTQAATGALAFEVLLNVKPASAAAIPVLSPKGLVFVGGATAPPPQTVQLWSSSANTSYQAAATTSSGGNWLSVTPASAATPGIAAQSSVSVNAGGLAAGVYTGAISYALSATSSRSAQVTLIVPNTKTPCAPSKLAPAPFAPLNGFVTLVSAPALISVQLLDDCGKPVTSGQAAAAFGNGDPVVPLTLSDASSGLYSGTWYPAHPAQQAIVTVTAGAAGLAAGVARYQGTVLPNQAPALTPQGTLNAFGSTAGAALAPGTIAQVYGSGLAGTATSAAALPLPISLAGGALDVGGIDFPIYYASGSQINAQVPFELIAEADYQMVASNNGVLSPPVTLHIAAVSPAVATQAGGIVIAQHADGSLVSEATPAKPAEPLTIYAAGLGLTDNPVASGAASPGSPLSQALTRPVVTLNSEQATVQFAGLTPGLAGLYQINFVVPADAANGDLTLSVSQGGAVASAVLPVHN